MILKPLQRVEKKLQKQSIPLLLLELTPAMAAVLCDFHRQATGLHRGKREERRRRRMLAQRAREDLVPSNAEPAAKAYLRTAMCWLAR